MLLENFYNTLMFYLQTRLNTLIDERNASDDVIEQLAYDSASSAIMDVIVQMQKLKCRKEST